MEIIKIVGNVRCDMPLCRQQAVYVFGGEGILPKRKIYICENCAKEMYEELGKKLTPKSPQNHIKLARDNQIKQKSGL